ncbi:alpha/beta fold hydrolase [Neptunomonas japonica]|uniref:Acyl-CoA esterase n=1 Tax=Neptunomonas japonica JAMM 1380 TaxID=1441457 RepID=A0A7R6P7T6_9GAMM|nr:alpha/beta fold hydrolase [Neptunomonas japonica]BBB28819.1 acyl-CoA esterase [Neptunomonas japonica JAMM 1380]
MKLHYQQHGTGTPLVILHGLFGTLENWGSQIKALSENFQVIAVDIRNHGRSPHSDTMNYPAMVEDIIELLDELELGSVDLMGHSMGGKAAMQLALTYPARIQKLIVVDISPVTYPHHHKDVLKGLFSIDLQKIKSRTEADKQLSTYISEPGVRAFLLKNLYRNDDKQFQWRMNLPVLSKAYSNISEAPSGTPFTGNTLFIKGIESDYIQAEHRDSILALFPQATYKLIQGAGHWPHAEKPAVFTKLLLNFLQA